MASDAFAQTRKTDGGVPIAAAAPVSFEGEACDPSHMSYLRFEPVAPTDVERFAQTSVTTDAIRGRAAMTLVELSACASLREMPIAAADQTAVQADAEPGEQLEAQSDGQSEARSCDRLDAQPKTQPGDRPDKRLDAELAGQPETQLGENSDAEPDEASDAHPESQPADDFAGQPADRPQVRQGDASHAQLDAEPAAQLDTEPATQLQIKGAELARFARAHGPLFAREPYAWPVDSDEITAGEPFDEDVFLWGSAAGLANFAVLAQECVNGSLPPTVAASMLGLVVWRVSDDAGSGFDLLMTGRAVSADYFEWLGAPRFIRREEAGGHIDYSFILGEVDEEAGTAELQVALASFEHEITASDYRMLSGALRLTGAIDREARERLQLDAAPDQPEAPKGAPSAHGSARAKADREQSAYRLSDDQMHGFDDALNEDDLPRLASMVRALVAAHLTDAYVDVFSAGGATGYLSFRSYLSWLWYDFSCNLGAVRVKYCVRCGRAYSVAGRRGPEKNYCSNDCRDAAHNERVGAKRDELRRAFLQGATVAELAARHYPDEDPATGAKRVRSLVESWPALKHEVDADIEAHGWHAPLFVRCHAEGLNVLKLLSSKRRRQLKAVRTGTKG